MRESRMKNQVQETAAPRTFVEPSYEVVPSNDVMQKVAGLKSGTLVHVMCVPAKGADVSVEIACEIQAQGYDAVPHITARTVIDRSHLARLVDKMRQGGITNVFVPGGEESVLGSYASGVALLDDLAELDHGLSHVGVPCYPDGHVEIDGKTLYDALLHKQQKIATYMVSQLVFKPEKIFSWLREMRTRGITLPLMIGVPGVISLQRLLKVCTQWRVGQTLKYIRMQPGLTGAIVRRQFNPKEIVDYCDRVVQDSSLKVENIHFITLNSVASTRAWWDAHLQKSTL